MSLPGFARPKNERQVLLLNFDAFVVKPNWKARPGVIFVVEPMTFDDGLETRWQKGPPWRRSLEEQTMEKC